MLKELKEMGFEERFIVEGLRQTDNNQQQTLNLLTQNVELLRSSDKNLDYATQDNIVQIMSMGYSREEAVKSLNISFGDVSSAVEKLLNSDPSLYSDIVTDPHDQTKNKEKEEMDIEEKQRKEKEKIERQELEKQLLDDVPEDEDEFLDISLDQEEGILNEYFLKVNQMQ